jgi:hypothetical protein
MDTFEPGTMIKISQHADFKYNNRRAGANGEIFDVYCSQVYDEILYEIEFFDDRGGYDLIRSRDVELA